MRRVPWRSLKFYSLLIVSLTAIMMFEPSCNREEIIARPSATFIIKGKAVSAEDQKPLDSVLVIMFENTAGMGPVKDVKYLTIKDSAVTDQEGNFEVIDSLAIPAEMSYTVLFKKVKNESKSTKLSIDSTFTYQFKDFTFSNGDGHWYSGKTSWELNVSLKQKKEGGN